MIGLVTAEARELIAELEKRRREARDGTPAHAAAEGEAEFREEERERRDELMKRHDVRHPDSGQFVPAPAHPYITAGHAADSPGNPPATPRANPAPVLPVPQVTPSSQPVVRQVFSADHPERHIHQGSAMVEHFAFAAPPVPVTTTPSQSPFRTAPINTGSTS